MAMLFHWLQVTIGVLAVCAWGTGMYYWCLTIRHRAGGVSLLSLSHPWAYCNSAYFSEEGLRYRRSTVQAFLVLLGLCLLGGAVRVLHYAIL